MSLLTASQIHNFNATKGLLQAIFLHEGILNETLSLDPTKNIWEFDELTILQQIRADEGGYLLNDLPVILGLPSQATELLRDLAIIKVEQLIDLRIQRVEDGMENEGGIDIHSLQRINQLLEVYKYINPDGLNSIQEKVLDFYSDTFGYIPKPLLNGKFDSQRDAVLEEFLRSSEISHAGTANKSSKHIFTVITLTSQDPFRDFSYFISSKSPLSEDHGKLLAVMDIIDKHKYNFALKVNQSGEALVSLGVIMSCLPLYFSIVELLCNNDDNYNINSDFFLFKMLAELNSIVSGYKESTQFSDILRILESIARMAGLSQQFSLTA